MRRTLALGALITVGCSDYDLHRPDDPAKGNDPVDTGTAPAEAPDISVTPTSMDFGGLPKECPADPVQVTITNEGLGDLVVSNIELSGDGFSAFDTTWDGSELTLMTEESFTFDVGFTPASWVDYAVDLRIESNDPDEGVVKVPATGSGAEDSIYEESFEQDYFETLDVLWVVDNSGSMGDDLHTAAANFEYFITVFADLGLDYHMAVVTTDMDNPAQSGRFMGEVITNTTSDPISVFMEQVDQGANGSGDEQGFNAVEAALTEPLLSTTNAGFLRDDAALGVVVLSDEDDGSDWVAVPDFVSWFQSLKSSTDLTTFSAICDESFFDMGCMRYAEAADSTGGMTADISTADYVEVLQQISMTSAGLTVSFDLEHEPSDLSRVTVEVEGTPIAMDATDGWTYDAEDISIIFHGDAIPEAGESGTVYYPVAGECPT